MIVDDVEVESMALFEAEDHMPVRCGQDWPSARGTAFAGQ
jgi:hypothetical protein